MTTLEFKIEINAPREKVWDVLWEEETYKKWTSVFGEGTYALSDWKEGSKIHFLSPSGDGMNSIIYQKIDNEYIAFMHLSEIKNFQEMPIDDPNQEWSGAMETYLLTENKGVTVLEAKMDSVEKYVDYFRITFPKALDLVKKFSEEK
ncbi:SRPBCC family protein [Flavobacterium xinjiangense]|uniref:Activator of Hsp90 ATPase homolog 1-like protein n=1 Tax=Flavobacterium xinjiangense TaxID=178356 RepID=A0A1M7DZY7_9FLAO|nr:SRPBCC domain-containing protein [Flavobacterium xinjiangense]SHL85052.1 Activator of Hsp90 ATPase homolog 1-like protein [Flavobacterium xinjiangense]